MATEKWTTFSAWGTAFTTAVPALTSTQAYISDLVIDNTASLNIFADFSIHLNSAAFAAPNFIGVYLYPLNYGGTVYGDGRTAASAFTGPPPSTYYVGSIGLIAATQAQDGILRGIILPPDKFSFCFYNQGGVTLSATNVCQYRTYNRSVA